MIELASPQPFTPVSHTADTGVRVRGATAEETLARLVLAYAQVASGGVAVERVTDRELAVAGGTELALIAVDLLRSVHRLVALERLVPAAVTVLACDEREGARVRLALGPFDRERFGEGLDVKAITYHAMRFERAAGEWVAQVIFDI